MLIIPCMISNLVWNDLGFCFNSEVSLILTLLCQPWEYLIARWLLGLLMPLLLMRCIMLIDVPSVISLFVRLNPGLLITGWIS